MAGAGIRSFAKVRGQMPRIATTGITSWQTALKWTADCQAPRSGCQEHAVRSGLWQSALKFRLLTVANRATVIFSVAIRSPLWIATIRDTHLSAEIGKRLNSSSHAILHRESPCLKSHIFLPRDF
jgi:hypothetical protein